MERNNKNIEGMIDRKAAPGSMFRPATLDEKTRSIEVVAATETPSTVYDPARYELVEEVLLMEGATYPAKVPLTIEHERYAGSVIGSLKDIKIEGGQMVGRVVFSSSLDAEPFFVKTKEGHLDSFSVTYNDRESVWIDEGQSGVVNGRTFSGPLLVTKKWTLRSLGLVIYPADKQAKARSGERIIEKEKITMDPKLRSFLERSGLKKDATEAEALAFLDTLQVERNQVETKPVTPVTPTPVVDPAEIARKAVEADRVRSTEIQAMCERAEYPKADMMKLLNDGDDVETARKKVFEYVMANKKDPNTPEHNSFEVLTTEKEKFRAAAEDGIVLRSGINHKIEKPALGARDLMGYSLTELARHSLRLAGQPYSGNSLEMVGRAMTTSDFPYILANVANKSLQLGWETTPETWKTWCATGSVNNFLEHTQVNPSEFSDLEELPEGSEYKYGKRTETKETYKVVTYGKMAAITRQAVINDDLNAITSNFMGMGEAAQRKVGDLPYAVLIANAVMGDGVALFDVSTHANYVTSGGAPGTSTIAAMILAMGIQKDLQGLRALNINPEYIIMPKTLEGAAEIFFQSTAFTDNTSAPTTDGTPASTRVNPYAGTRFQRVYEGRLDAAGLTAGWFGAARKGKTITVFFLNGVQTPYMETQKGWNVDGTEYKVRIDAGAKAVDWRGLYWNDGA